MAEVEGLAARIIQIAEAGAKLSVALYNFTNSAARADQYFKDIADDVELTSNELESVGKVFESEDAKSIVSKKAIQDANNIINKCEGVFDEVSEMVEKRRKIGKDGKQTLRVTGKLTWPMKVQRIELNRKRLESLKNSLMLFLHVLQLAQGQLRGKMEKSGMEEERDKTCELHQRQQDSLKSLQALESRFCNVALDDDETLQGSNIASRIPTLDLMANTPTIRLTPLEKNLKTQTNNITTNLSRSDGSDKSDSDATMTDKDDEHVSIRELSRAAKHVTKLLKRITVLQKSLDTNQKTCRKQHVHKMYQGFCRKFETSINLAQAAGPSANGSSTTPSLSPDNHPLKLVATEGSGYTFSRSSLLGGFTNLSEKEDEDMDDVDTEKERGQLQGPIDDSMASSSKPKLVRKRVGHQRRSPLAQGPPLQFVIASKPDDVNPGATMRRVRPRATYLHLNPLSSDMPTDVVPSGATFSHTSSPMPEVIMGQCSQQIGGSMSHDPQQWLPMPLPPPPAPRNEQPSPKQSPPMSNQAVFNMDFDPASAPPGIPPQFYPQDMPPSCQQTQMQQQKQQTQVQTQRQAAMQAQGQSRRSPAMPMLNEPMLPQTNESPPEVLSEQSRSAVSNLALQDYQNQLMALEQHNKRKPLNSLAELLLLPKPQFHETVKSHLQHTKQMQIKHSGSSLGTSSTEQPSCESANNDVAAPLPTSPSETGTPPSRSSVERPRYKHSRNGLKRSRNSSNIGKSLWLTELMTQYGDPPMPMPMLASPLADTEATEPSVQPSPVEDDEDDESRPVKHWRTSEDLYSPEAASGRSGSRPATERFSPYDEREQDNSDFCRMRTPIVSGADRFGTEGAYDASLGQKEKEKPIEIEDSLHLADRDIVDMLLEQWTAPMH